MTDPRTREREAFMAVMAEANVLFNLVNEIYLDTADGALRRLEAALEHHRRAVREADKEAFASIERKLRYAIKEHGINEKNVCEAAQIAAAAIETLEEKP